MPLFLVRMLVYEFVDNGNLDQWLHGDVGEVSPLTWDIRMKIILGTAKGYYIPSMTFCFILYTSLTHSRKMNSRLISPSSLLSEFYLSNQPSHASFVLLPSFFLRNPIFV